MSIMDDSANKPPGASASSRASRPSNPLRLPSAEAAELDQSRTEEKRHALRALLRKPLLLAGNPDDAIDFARVRLNADPLRDWFQHQAGWSLDVSTDFARLRKTPADLRDATRPAIEPQSGEPLTRRRYAVLCLAFAFLTNAGRQTTLGTLANAIVARWHDENFDASGFVFTMGTPDERRDLIHVIRLLLSWQVLQRVDGSEEKFLHDQNADVLYNIRHFILGRLLNVRHSPSLVTDETDATLDEKLETLTKEPLADSEEQQNRGIRLNIVRRLLDDPVVYYRELDAATNEYLLRQRWHIMRQLTEATGLVSEERAEGFALADPAGDCTDIGLPEEGTDGHVTILVAEYLAQCRHAAEGDAVPLSRISDFVAQKRDELQQNDRLLCWRKDARQPGAERQLALDAVARLAGLSLVRTLPDGSILPMPAIHRFRLKSIEYITRPAQASSTSTHTSSP